MCDILVQTTSRGYVLALQGACGALRTGRGVYEYVMHKVVDVTHTLFGTKTAQVAYEVLETLPFSILMATYPVPVLAGLALVHILARDFVFEDSVYDKIPLILRNSPAVKVLQHTIGCVVNSPSSNLSKVGLWFLITAVSQVVLTYFGLLDDE